MASALLKGEKRDGKKRGETRELQPLKVTASDDPGNLKSPAQMSGTPSSVTSFHREQSPSTSEMASTPTDESQVDGRDEGDGETTLASGGDRSKKEKKKEKKAKEKEEKKAKERERQEKEKEEKERKKQERKERKQEKKGAEKQHSKGGSFLRHKKKSQDTQPPIIPHEDGQAQQIPGDDHASSDATPEGGVSVSDKKETTHDEGSGGKPQDTRGVSVLM